MSPAKKPVVLLIDDQSSQDETLKKSLGDHATVHFRLPGEFLVKDLTAADLVLVDHELDNWSPRPKGASTPPNGLALSAVIRARLNSQRRGYGVTGVALYTGRIERIAGSVPEEVRGFVLARLNNLEWVFEKGEALEGRRVLSLAEAITKLPRSWPTDVEGANAALQELLALPSGAYRETALDDISACHPPIHELTSVNHALVVIRWIAQRVLPYPTFLIDRYDLAARLQIFPDDLQRLLGGRSMLATELGKLRYAGVLAELCGERWWRAGVDHALFRWSEGASGIDARRAAITKLAGQPISFLEGELVPAIGESHRSSGLVAVENAVRLRLDDWPPFAADAWAERALVADSPRLRGLVLPDDRELLT